MPICKDLYYYPSPYHHTICVFKGKKLTFPPRESVWKPTTMLIIHNWINEWVLLVCFPISPCPLIHFSSDWAKLKITTIPRSFPPTIIFTQYTLCGRPPTGFLLLKKEHELAHIRLDYYYDCHYIHHGLRQCQCRSTIYYIPLEIALT